MEDIRYIDNPFFKIFNIVNPDHSQLYSLLIRQLEKFFNDIKIPTVMSTASLPSESREDISAYTGTSGYLYMFIRAYRYFNQRNQQDTQTLASKSHIVGDQKFYKLTDPLFYLKVAEEQYQTLEKYIEKQKPQKSCFSFYMSQVCVWVCGMHLAFIKKNLAQFRKNQQRIYRCFETLKNNISNKTYWEVLYGVPGFLYSVLQLQKNYDNAAQTFKTNFSPLSKELTHMIIKQGIKNYENLTKSVVNLQKLPEDFRLVYYFGKSEYLGGAHGLGGNLCILLSSVKYNDFQPNLKGIIGILKSSVAFLLKHLINGNFATSAGSQKVKLVHFCHGAPGIVTALAKFMELFPEMGIQLGLKEVINANLNHIWKFGVLKKGFGLCHGISGNAYTFISPSLRQVFHDRADEFLKKAQLFALLKEQQQVQKQISQYNFKDRNVKGKSDEPYSLMTGIAGDICFTVDVLLGEGCFPGYDV